MISSLLQVVNGDNYNVSPNSNNVNFPLSRDLTNRCRDCPDGSCESCLIGRQSVRGNSSYFLELCLSLSNFLVQMVRWNKFFFFNFPYQKITIIRNDSWILLQRIIYKSIDDSYFNIQSLSFMLVCIACNILSGGAFTKLIGKCCR